MSEQTSQYYINRPITAKDGADSSGNRAEVRVQTGYAFVDDVIDKKSQQTAKFSFTFEGTKLKHPVGGWIHKTEDKEIYEMLKKAYDDETPIHFRIESKRRDHIDRSIPIDDILTLEQAKEKTITIIAGVKINASDDWILSSERVTLPSEDQVQGSVPATPENSAESVNSPLIRSHAKIENPSYLSRNNDGSINPGGNAVSAITNTYMYVFSYQQEHPEIEMSDTDVFRITGRILSICNNAQLHVYGSKLTRPNMSLSSHVRARSLVFHTIDNVNPITKEILNDEEQLKAWEETVLERVKKMWSWSINLADSIEA